MSSIYAFGSAEQLLHLQFATLLPLRCRRVDHSRPQLQAKQTLRQFNSHFQPLLITCQRCPKTCRLCHNNKCANMVASRSFFLNHFFSSFSYQLFRQTS